MNANIETAISIAGSQTALAKACGVTQAAVWKWLQGKALDAKHAIAIEKATNGVVRCEQLLPDVDWHYLRGTKKAKAA